MKEQNACQNCKDIKCETRSTCEDNEKEIEIEK